MAGNNAAANGISVFIYLLFKHRCKDSEKFRLSKGKFQHFFG